VLLPLTHAHKILIVEDDAEARAALVMLLELNAFEVRTAGDGAEALDILRHGFRPCLVLLDLHMPQKTGFEFRQEQLEDAAIRDIPVVVFSGAAKTNATARALGIHDFLQKPADMSQFFSIIRQRCAA
jgi:two-component system, chemotaxis family, chemotaxis protein CheY